MALKPSTEPALSVLFASAAQEDAELRKLPAGNVEEVSIYSLCPVDLTDGPACPG